jgi:hypothetical protein
MEKLKIDSGLITGTEIGATGKGIRIFKGIP